MPSKTLIIKIKTLFIIVNIVKNKFSTVNHMHTNYTVNQYGSERRSLPGGCGAGSI